MKWGGNVKPSGGKRALYWKEYRCSVVSADSKLVSLSG
jgi:hypothetical protein